MNRAFIGTKKTGSHLYALSTKHKRCGNTSAVCDAACGNDWQGGRITNLRNENHSGKLAYMTAAFATLCNESRSAEASQQFSHSNRSNNRNNLNPCGKPFFNIFRWIACTRGYNLNLFFYNNLGHFICKGAKQHNIYANRFIGDTLGNLNLLPDIIGGSISCRNNANTAAIGHGSGQFTVSDPSHTTLKYRIFDTQHFTNC